MSFKSCPVCRTRVNGFLPLPSYYAESAQRYGFSYGLEEAETLNHREYTCPVCVSSDRDRLFAVLFSRIFSGLDEARPYFFLDIAPAAGLSRWFRSHPHIFYRSADMFMDGVDDKVDLQNLPYPTDTFDFILCSHVLEHVPDDVKAASELQRVLKPDGAAVVLVPIIKSLEHTYENPEVVTPEDRWKHFGQDDHVRLYSQSGFLDTLKRGGLFATAVPVMSLISPERCDTHGIARDSILYLCTKSAIPEEVSTAA